MSGGGISIKIYIKEKPKINLNIIDRDNRNIKISIDIYDTIENLYKLAEMKLERKILLGNELFSYCDKFLSKNNSMINEYDFSTINNILQLVKCPFCIFIKNLSGKISAIPCKSTDTIIIIKEKAEEQIDLPVDEQRLIYGGKQLEDEKTLADYNIKHLSILHAVLRLR